MLELAGYQNFKKITEGAQYVIYSALRNDAVPVILKVLKSDRPSPDMLALLYHEHEISHRLNMPGTIRVYDIIEQENQYALVLEDIQGISLSNFLQQKPIQNLSTFLKLAIEMTRIISDLHQHHIIHKDIKPENFIIHPETLLLKLTDFNYSSKLMHETQEIVSPEKLEGTLAYMAPEQTGRMNMNIDYRSDYYALGVTFYEMLTGKLPFIYDDPLELLHAHLVNPPPEISNTHFDIPQVLQELVQKLMAKNPSDRYQSAVGLQMDLELCEKLFEKDSKIESFPLGKHDISDHLNLSEKLYGRENEVKFLLAEYDSVAQGAVEALMISGYSGIGKTRLINEVHKPMLKQKGYFISGKFDQLQKDTPYIAITQAFNQLARLILAESEERFETLKRAIQDALGGVGQVIIELAPDFERIIGPQAPLDKLPPKEAQNRMMVFFRRFLGAIAQRNHPLVLFIDDLQWIDSGSLQLLEYLMTDEELSHVLLIGSYRENEVDDYHPLKQFFEVTKKKGKKVHFLFLAGLTIEHFESFFRDTFNRDDQDIKIFSELIHKRTNGNPFFCKQVISLLYGKNLLYFDYKAHRWDWDLGGIQALKITDNVVELMLHKLTELPEETQKLLRDAACVGNRFTIETLMVISGQSPEAIAEALWPAMQDEIIQTPGLSYKRVEALKNKNLSVLLSKEITYQFIHDRVQQAAYESIPAADRQKTHLAIAHLLMEKEPKACLKERLFEVVGHFNLAHELIESREKFRVIDLNYRAAMQARNANAFQPMSNYLLAALNLMDENAWGTDYETTFKVNRDYALSLFSLGNAAEAEALINKLLFRAKNNFDKVSLYALQLRSFHAQGEMDKSLVAGRAALALLGVHFPTQVSFIDLLLKWLEIRWHMRRFHIESLDKELPPLTDPNIVAAFEIFPQLMGPASWKSASLQQYVVLMAMDLQLQFGKPRNASWCVVAYAYVTLNIFKNLDRAFQYFDLSKKLFDESPCKDLIGISCAMLAPVSNYRKPIKEAAAYYKMGIQGDTESGDIVSESYLKGGYAINTWAEANSLNTTIDQLDYVVKAYENAGMKSQGALAEMNSILLKKLSSDEPNLTDRFNELNDFIIQSGGELIKINHFKRLSFYYYFMEMFEEALVLQDSWRAESERFRYGTLNYEIKMLGGLLLAQFIPSMHGLKKWKYRRLFRKLLSEVRWASNECPVNFLHHYSFLKGAQARLKKQYLEAITAFNEGIESAKKGDFYLWAALGNELVSDLYIEQDQPRAAIDYIREAHYYYHRYGLTRKVEALERRYPQCFLGLENKGFHSTTGPATTSSSLDFMSIVKASQAIAGEIILDKLFEKILHVILENAGAEKALFLELSEGAWRVVATLERQKTLENFYVLNIPLKEYKDIPGRVIQYTLRSQEPVVLNNAVENSQYHDDPYIAGTQAKSVLSLPVLHHDKVIGIIYLENNVTIGAFTQDRVTVLRALASQIAISLENSHYLDRMQHLYRSTERFVPKKFLEIIHKENIEEVSLGDCVKRDISVLFTDMRNFTTILEKRTPEDAFSFVNRYWEYMAPVIRENQGFIGQYQGDAILALFPRAPEDAVNAGIAMLQAIKQFNQLQLSRGELPLEMGIGINSGSAMLGIIGEKERLEQAVISDVTNTAARVESLNKSYGTHFLLSDNTINLLLNREQYSLRRVDKVRLKGRKTSTYLYELIDWVDRLQRISLADFLALYDETFLKYEQGNFLEAKKGFEKCASHLTGDKITQILLGRCELFMKEGAPEAWDGTFTLTFK